MPMSRAADRPVPKQIHTAHANPRLDLTFKTTDVWFSGAPASYSTTAPLLLSVLVIA